MAVDVSPPAIPDHELLRVIGRGAYGEIWLARSLIGALRAVKVVWRSTFESDRAFHREFEGMSRFEPFSRAHDGFVDILHVGRRAEFFYYIMELADDCERGRDIDPIHYSPRTLKAMLQGSGRLPVDDCVAIGLRLTEALDSLHGQELTHRDVKPANIIFVDRAPKLADIGLVAVTGQRSFVGTEGYVPPEGPGTAQGDLYSLGKVLYEISTGQDRLDFPALHSDLSSRGDKESLLRLNDVLLRACANDPAARYASAGAMHADLVRVRDGGRVVPARSMLPRVCMVLSFLVVAIASAVWWFSGASSRGTAAARAGEAAISTDPPGALVLIGDRMLRSPALFSGLKVGQHDLRVMLPGFDPLDTTVEITGGARSAVPLIRLARSKGSLEVNSDPSNAEFELVTSGGVVRRGTTPAKINDLPTGEDYHLVVRRKDWELREPVTIKRGEGVVKNFEFAHGTLVIESVPPGVQIAIDGHPSGATPLRLDVRAGPHKLRATHEKWPALEQEVSVHSHQATPVKFEFGYGAVKITSSPAGATVVAGGSDIGQTPLWLDEVQPGEVEYELHLPGYKAEQVRGTVLPRQQAFFAARLEKKLSPQPGEPWENSLGMRFVTVGGVRFSVWETRVADYAAFCEGTNVQMERQDFNQTATDPVVKVNWFQAKAFCAWLTSKEMGENLLEDHQSYRLPTDREWSIAAGLGEETGRTPEERDGKLKEVFPWGKQWPPPGGSGNYADQNAKAGRRIFLEGYTDGFAWTAPAGSFAANGNSLHDMGGNVWEWCEEGYKGLMTGKDWGVLRGGSWANSSRGELQTSYRNVIDRNERDVIYGFRCVLVDETTLEFTAPE